MKIRKALKRDYPKIREFVFFNISEIFGKNVTGYKDLNNIKKNFILFLVAEDKGEIVGTIGIKLKNGEPKIARMYIKKSERGKGLGKKLMRKALKFGKGKFERVYLTTYKKMNVTKFYENFGFKVFKRDKRIWMEKFL
jgi:predicted GNAT family N-acyltransferase